MSQRVMSTLTEITPEVEVYSMAQHGWCVPDNGAYLQFAGTLPDAARSAS